MLKLSEDVEQRAAAAAAAAASPALQQRRRPQTFSYARSTEANQSLPDKDQVAIGEVLTTSYKMRVHIKGLLINAKVINNKPSYHGSRVTGTWHRPTKIYYAEAYRHRNFVKDAVAYETTDNKFIRETEEIWKAVYNPKTKNQTDIENYRLVEYVVLKAVEVNAGEPPLYSKDDIERSTKRLWEDSERNVAKFCELFADKMIYLSTSLVDSDMEYYYHGFKGVDALYKHLFERTEEEHFLPVFTKENLNNPIM